MEKQHGENCNSAQHVQLGHEAPDQWLRRWHSYFHDSSSAADGSSSPDQCQRIQISAILEIIPLTSFFAPKPV
jgi:hypothetical protein